MKLLIDLDYTRASIILAVVCLTIPAYAATPVFELEIRNHLFHPDTLVVPANTKVKLIIYNRDSTPEEFESYELNREKVILGERKAIVFIGPLAPGNYPFFGEFNPQTALGTIVAKDKDDAAQ
ncbi:MAG: cupredoxin domain-containing protein [Woeseiaceae bacterium]